MTTKQLSEIIYEAQRNVYEKTKKKAKYELSCCYDCKTRIVFNYIYGNYFYYKNKKTRYTLDNIEWVSCLYVVDKEKEIRLFDFGCEDIEKELENVETIN